MTCAPTLSTNLGGCGCIRGSSASQAPAEPLFVNVGVIGRVFMPFRAMGFPRVWVSALKNAISHIVAPCSEKQVTRVTATRVVATVTNVSPVGNISISNNPGHAVRALHFACSAGPANGSISSASVCGSEPFPALGCIASFDLGPKAGNHFISFFHSSFMIEVRARCAATTAAALAYCTKFVPSYNIISPATAHSGNRATLSRQLA